MLTEHTGPPRKHNPTPGAQLSLSSTSRTQKWNDNFLSKLIYRNSLRRERKNGANTTSDLGPLRLMVILNINHYQCKIRNAKCLKWYEM